MPESTLLGVGGGIIRPVWAKTQHADLMREPSPEEPIDDATAKDERIVKESVADLLTLAVQLSQSIDLDNILANTTANQDVTVTATGRVASGDYIIFTSGTLTHGHIIVGCSAPANDTIRIRHANLTGAAINESATTLTFVVVKRIS